MTQSPPGDLLLQQETDTLLAEGDLPSSTQGASLYAFPATLGQTRFWSLDQLDAGNPALNMPLMWECTGPLDLHAMQEAFALCADRHEALRTTFDVVDGRLSQILHPVLAISISLIDLEQFETEMQQAKADRVTREHAAYRFDLKHGPLLVLKMLRFAAERHLLLVTMHHIICDGISNGILLRDMRAFYEALITDRAPALPELPIQFPDYAVWQEKWLNGLEPAASLAFWRESLGSDFQRLSVPRDPDAIASVEGQRDASTGAIETLLIPPDLQARAHLFCKRENLTLNILLFSVFALLMNRLTGRRDLAIGSPCANRSEETAELIGLFMNIQVLRLRLSETETFRSLLEKVRDWTLGAYENQALPFEVLVHDHHFSTAGNAFEIPVFFLYQKSFMVTQRIGEFEIVPLRSESPGATFEIMFAVVDRIEEGPRLQLEYNPCRSKRSTIQGYLRMFNDLLSSALFRLEDQLDDLHPFGEASGTMACEPTSIAEQRNNSTASEEAEPDDAFLPPRDVIERQLASLWQTTLGIPEISMRDNFFSLGVGSLAALRLITKVNRVFALDLGLASLISSSTIEDIARLIRTRAASHTTNSLVPLQPKGTRPPLFITHGVGGNVISFYGLAARLGEDQPVYGIQAQSLVGREAAWLRMEDLAAYYVRDLRGVQAHGPYFLLGYSFGGTLALEMAQQLRLQGQEVALLGMLDARTRRFDMLMAQAASGSSRVHSRIGRFRGNTSRLAATAHLRYVLDKLHTRAVRFACVAATKLNWRQVPAWMRSASDINNVAIRNYHPKSYDGRLVLFRASDQEHAGARPDLGWGEVFQDGVEIHNLPGDHERIFLEPNLDQLAAQLRAALERTTNGAV